MIGKICPSVSVESDYMGSKREGSESGATSRIGNLKLEKTCNIHETTGHENNLVLIMHNASSPTSPE